MTHLRRARMIAVFYSLHYRRKAKVVGSIGTARVEKTILTPSTAAFTDSLKLRLTKRTDASKVSSTLLLMPNLYDIPLTNLSGKPSSLAEYKGKILLIVNVASKCGLTPQYTALEQLYQQFKQRDFFVLGFPSNDFAGQEPGTNQEIAQFCSTEYPVSFPMFSKITVLGEEMHPLYKELISAQPYAITDEASSWRSGLESYAKANGFPPPTQPPDLLWNFEKFLMGRDGNVLARFAPDMKPDDPRIVLAIEKALEASPA